MNKTEKIHLYASLHFAYRAVYASLLETNYQKPAPSKNPARVSDSAYARLVKHQWLDDEAISEVAANLSSSGFVVLNSHFYRLLQLGNFESAVRWFNSQVPAPCRRFCVAVNLSNTHWVGFYVDVALRLALISDSMGGSFSVLGSFVHFIRHFGQQLGVKFEGFESFVVLWRNLEFCHVSDISDTPQRIARAVVVDVVDLDDSDEHDVQEHKKDASNAKEIAAQPIGIVPVTQVLESDRNTSFPDQESDSESDELESADFPDVEALIGAVKRFKATQIHPIVAEASPNLRGFPEAHIDVSLAYELHFKLDEIANEHFSHMEARALRLIFYAKCMPTQQNGSDCGVFTSAFLIFCAGMRRCGSRFEICAADEISGENSALWRRKLVQYIM